MGDNKTMTDFIKYPPRETSPDKLCKCSHKKASHIILKLNDITLYNDCMICMCPRFDVWSERKRMENGLFEGQIPDDHWS